MGLSTISYLSTPFYGHRNTFLITLFLNICTKVYQRPKFFDLCFTSPLMKAGIGQSMWSTVCSGVERECEGEKRNGLWTRKVVHLGYCSVPATGTHNIVWYTILLYHYYCEVPEQPQHTKEKMCLGLVQTLINYRKLGIYVGSLLKIRCIFTQQKRT